MLPIQRAADPWGSGAYKAPRGSGRLHRGIDLIAYPGAPILSVCDGVFTKYGYPYSPSDPKKGHLRYVQITSDDEIDFRYFYISIDLCIPEVCSPVNIKLNDFVQSGDLIGNAQGLWDVYDKRMTNHFHFEVRKGRTFLDPRDFL